MTARERMARIERRKERVAREAAYSILVAKHREAAGFSKQAASERLGISEEEYRRKEDPDCQRHFSGADHVELSRLLPTFAVATAPRRAGASASCLTKTVAQLGLLVAELNLDLEAALEDRLILPAEGSTLRMKMHEIAVRLASAEQRLDEEVVAS